MKKILLILLAAMTLTPGYAQRKTDQLDRGLVAVKVDGGVFCSWRINAEEYYDVEYNLYCDGTKVNDAPLKVSNFVDASGTTSNTYTVRAVVKGVEQSDSKAVNVLNTKYKEITPQHSNTLVSTYEPNDACCADVDGDGEMEILIKYRNVEEYTLSYLHNGFHGEHDIFECLEMDGTVKWWVECGPNMGDFQSNESNIVAFDWDLDGKAEAVLRLAEGSKIHQANGQTYTIGADGRNNTSWTDYRIPRGALSAKATDSRYPIVVYITDQDVTAVTSNQSWCVPSYEGRYVKVVLADNGAAAKTPNVASRSATLTITTSAGNINYTVTQAGTSGAGNDLGGTEWFTHYGNEFLVYANGETGEPYQVIDFPLKRYEQGESDLSAAWGDGYGHRSSKYFFGAPYLDGKKPSIFLARGIYTRHKMIAYDVNPSTHALTTRWTWNNNSNGPWKGQGYHNYCIADVDMDGRDEIVFGSMVIDDNGKGLSTTGLGHGDAQHVSDFNPYIHGLEGFFCNEDAKQNNYRDMTTSDIYYEHHTDGDDGRAIMGNFSNAYPGSIGSTARDGDYGISSIINGYLPVRPTGLQQNFRIYWDGDLLEETLNGGDTDCSIYKMGNYLPIESFTGSALNNGTKATPCFQGDIYGDWREEVIVRTPDNKIRIYTTTTPTEYRNYTLWHDHQYRNAMVWQPCGYNQPPHVSYFLGELEGITMAPPPLTTVGREIISNGGTISASHNGKHVLVHENDNASVTVSGATPSIVTFNVPTWVQGTAASECTTKDTPINTTVYTLTVNGAFSGDTRIVKQGDGILKLANVAHTNTGPTDIWEGTMDFHNSLSSSDVWMNRHTTLNAGDATGNATLKSLTMEYGSTLIITSSSDADNVAKLNIGNLTIKEGSRIKLNFDKDNESNCDMLNVSGDLTVVKKDWLYGPEYSAPVVEFTPATLEKGQYKVGEVAGNVTGSLNDIVIEGITPANGTDRIGLRAVGNDLVLYVEGQTEATVNTDIAWKLDFEETSDNNYGFTLGSNVTATQYTKTDGSHMLHVYQGGGSGDRNADKSLVGVSQFNTSYRFEFDWGFSSGNQNTSTTSLLSESNKLLFKIETTANHTSVPLSERSISTLFDGYGNAIINLKNNGHIASSTCPTNLTHFIIESSNEGTYITVSDDRGTLVDRYQVSETFERVTALKNNLGRALSNLALDNLIVYNLSTELSDQKLPPAAGTYTKVNVYRKLYKGYNTLCMPVAINDITSIAGANAVAYELSGSTTSNGETVLNFTQANQLEANTPYVVYVDADVTLPHFNTATTIVSTNESGSISAGGWTFKGNYVPHLNVAGNYILYNDEIRHAGPQAYVDGLRGYFIPPTGATSAKVRCVFGDEVVDAITEVKASANGDGSIFSIDGKRKSSISSGINIIRQSNGKTIKVIK